MMGKNHLKGSIYVIRNECMNPEIKDKKIQEEYLQLKIQFLWKDFHGSVN